MNNLLFENLNIRKEILKGLEAMGFSEMTAIQAKAIPPILAKQDVVAQAPTGTGKTCAFGIPVIEELDFNIESVQTLILCPTRELVLQTTTELEAVAKYIKGVKIVPIYGGQPIERQIALLKKRPQIIVATPGRTIDHIKRRTVKLSHVKMLILDEADEMLNMGFREDIDEILKSAPLEKQTILFSATLPKAILDITHKYQKNEVFVSVANKELTVPLVEQWYYKINSKNKTDAMLKILIASNFKLAIAFCNTKRMVDDLTATLNNYGYKASALHGDMRQSQRDKVMADYRKGLINILVATDVAARGIDVENVEAVFNYDLPYDAEYYVHRIGRTGRANRTGNAYTLITAKELGRLNEIRRLTKANIKPLELLSNPQIEEIKMRAIIDEVASKYKLDKLKKYSDFIETLDISPLDIATLLLKNELGDLLGSSHEDDNNINERENDFIRMFINIGKIDKIKVKDLVDIIVDNASLSPSQITKIDMYDKYSFFETKAKNGSKILNNISGLKIGRRNLNVEIANNKKRGV